MTGFVVNHNRINKDFDRVLKNFIGSPACACGPNDEFVPAVDIVEKDDLVSLYLELPGMEKGDIKVVVKDDVLTVSGERKSEAHSEENNIIRSEIYTGAFSRAFTIPDNIDSDSIKADYKNGVLKIILTKKEETRPKEIEVNVK